MASSSRLSNEDLVALLMSLLGQLKQEGFIETKVIDGELHIILKMKETKND